MHRGMAYAARRDFRRALAGLTRACALAPRDPQFLYERGVVRRQSGQLALALEDFDSALELDPNDVPVLLARAELRVGQGQLGVEGDLNAVDRPAPPEANLRLRLGMLYDAVGEYAGAIHEHDLWIDYHGDDVRLPMWMFIGR
jgi:tetratricopeptide (TPR) repeat protein